MKKAPVLRLFISGTIGSQILIETLDVFGIVSTAGIAPTADFSRRGIIENLTCPDTILFAEVLYLARDRTAAPRSVADAGELRHSHQVNRRRRG